MSELDRYYQIQTEGPGSKDKGRLPDAIQIATRFLNKDERILDVGCSSDHNLELWQKINFGQVTGFDLRTDIRDSIQGDMHDMKDQYGKWDAIFSSHTLEHAYDYHKALEEFKQVAKKIFIIVPLETKIESAGNPKHVANVTEWGVIKHFKDDWMTWYSHRFTPGKELVFFALHL